MKTNNLYEFPYGTEQVITDEIPKIIAQALQLNDSKKRILAEQNHLIRLRKAIKTGELVQVNTIDNIATKKYLKNGNVSIDAFRNYARQFDIAINVRGMSWEEMQSKIQKFYPDYGKEIKEKPINVEENLETITPDSNEIKKLTPEDQRKTHDLTKESGSRYHIIKNWDRIENIYGKYPIARQVEAFLKGVLTPDGGMPSYKTIQTYMSKLRGENLIPKKNPKNPQKI
jgi:hypothetical protein